MAIPIPERIKRYQTWLKREPADRPLIGLIWEPDIPPHPDLITLSVDDQEVIPERIDPAAVLPLIEKWHRRDAQLTCDTIHCFCPAFGMPWMEAMAGCRVTSHPGSLWAEPALSSYQNRDPIQFDPENPWLRKLIEFTRILVENSNGRYPVALPQMRGPLDVLAALRSPEQMCIDILQQPREVKLILNEITDLWIAVNRTILDQIPLFFNGTLSRMKAWMPGKTITPQNDVSSLISAAAYRELAMACDTKIISSFPYHCYHLHATEYTHIATLLNLGPLTALQVTLEHTLGGPSLDIMMPLLRDILERKPLLLCALDIESADHCIRELPAAGLAVTIGLQGGDFDRVFDEWLSSRCS